MFCYKCGNQIRQEENFCNSCGTKVINESINSGGNQNGQYHNSGGNFKGHEYKEKVSSSLKDTLNDIGNIIRRPITLGEKLIENGKIERSMFIILGILIINIIGVLIEVLGSSFRPNVMMAILSSSIICLSVLVSSILATMLFLKIANVDDVMRKSFGLCTVALGFNLIMTVISSILMIISTPISIIFMLITGLISINIYFNLFNKTSEKSENLNLLLVSFSFLVMIIILIILGLLFLESIITQGNFQNILFDMIMGWF